MANLVLQQGKNAAGEQVVPQSFFSDLVTERTELKTAFEDYHWLFPNGNYRSHFWVRDAGKKQFAMLGAYGQTAYFDLKHDLAVVTFGSYPEALDSLLADSLQTLWDRIAESVGTSNVEPVRRRAIAGRGNTDPLRTAPVSQRATSQGAKK